MISFIGVLLCMQKVKEKIMLIWGGWQIKARGHLEGVNSFKEKWGGEIAKYYVYSYNPFYILGRKAIRNSRFFRWVWDRIKRRPHEKRNENEEQ